MTPEQRVFDFQHLAAVMAKNYGPYEWKREAFGFDLYEIGPWVERVRKTQNDLDYYEIASEYVASLRDSHAQYQVPSLFVADARLNADIYDGRVLLDSIDRNHFPEPAYPFAIGDEVLSVDGRAAADWIRELSRFIGEANDRSRARQAATYLFFRPQRVVPRALQLGEKSVVVVRRANDAVQAFEIPWHKTSLPIVSAGTVPSPHGRRRFRASGEDKIPEQLHFLRRLQNREVRRSSRVLGDGERNPYFALPEGFVTRLGRSAFDFHYSGIYPAEGKRIGYLRFPNFAPRSNSEFVSEFC
jgi:hypothetical protein